MRLKYFEDKKKWDEKIARRARVLMEYVFEAYEQKYESTNPSSTKPSTKSKTAFGRAMEMMGDDTDSFASELAGELAMYYSMAYPCRDGDVLGWWKVRPQPTVMTFRNAHYPLI